ncbi:MAG: D-2-hydroxyacid dehydrogenase [Saccharofermentanales bacterium]|jgi:D-3-phosphoglycerate dehydrogenase
MAKILANDGIAKAAEEELIALGHEVDTNKYEGDELLKKIAEVDAIVVRSATKLRDPQIDAGAAGNLKLIIRGGVGVDNINVDYAREKGIVVRNTPAASSSAVAELVLGHMLSMARHIGEANRTMREGQWLKKQYAGTEIAGKTLGLIGFGRIARSLAQKCLCLGMDVIYTDILDIESDTCCQCGMEEVLKRADYVSVHVPFSGGEPLIGRDEIAMMKDGVFIINAARGGVIDEDALVDAIEAGKVRGAALDVYIEEPLKNERVRNCDLISLTPHIGAATAEAQGRIGDEIVAIVKEVL